MAPTPALSGMLSPLPNLGATITWTTRCCGQDRRNEASRHAAEETLGYTDGRPPGAGKFAISMENAQEGVWLLVISLSYPRQTLPNICVQWPSRARDACAKTPVPRRDFPPFLRAPLMAFSSMAWLHLGTNDWRSLPEVYVATFHPHYDPPILITGVKTCRCSDHLSSLEHARSLRHR